MENKIQLITKAGELGFKYERDYGSCAQCTILAVLNTLKINNPFIFKAASGLACGGGKMCDGVCGGYSGGIMVMSLIFGRQQDRILNDDENKNISFFMATKLREQFIDKYGSVICKEIHNKIFGRNFDMYDSIERQLFNDEGAHTVKCTDVVRFSSGKTMLLLLDEAEKRKMSLNEIKTVGSI